MDSGGESRCSLGLAWRTPGHGGVSLLLINKTSVSINQEKQNLSEAFRSGEHYAKEERRK